MDAGQRIWEAEQARLAELARQAAERQAAIEAGLAAGGWLDRDGNLHFDNWVSYTGPGRGYWMPVVTTAHVTTSWLQVPVTAVALAGGFKLVGGALTVNRIISAITTYVSVESFNEATTPSGTGTTPKPVTSVGQPFNPSGGTVQVGVDPNTLIPTKNLTTLDPIRQANAVQHAGSGTIIVDRSGVILDGHHRVLDAIQHGRMVDIQIGY